MRRRVAVKVLKAGMDTRQVVARFEAERQALAMMDHPNIAKILDGGEADHGHPFFVMELVRGTPITRYCDREQLDPKARLRLFAQVCRAVQHAHQKGIIHRDLKPSNILVTTAEREPATGVVSRNNLGVYWHDVVNARRAIGEVDRWWTPTERRVAEQNELADTHRNGGMN